MLPLSQAIELIDQYVGIPISNIPEDTIESIKEAQYSELWYSIAFHTCPLCGGEGGYYV